MRMGYLAIGYSEYFAQMAQTSVLTSQSVAFGISFTGATKSVCDAMAAAGEAGAHTICLTRFCWHSNNPLFDDQVNHRRSRWRTGSELPRHT